MFVIIRGVMAATVDVVEVSTQVDLPPEVPSDNAT